MSEEEKPFLHQYNTHDKVVQLVVDSGASVSHEPQPRQRTRSRSRNSEVTTRYLSPEEIAAHKNELLRAEMFRVALELAGGDESRLIIDDDGITIQN